MNGRKKPTEIDAKRAVKRKKSAKTKNEPTPAPKSAIDVASRLAVDKLS